MRLKWSIFIKLIKLLEMIINLMNCVEKIVVKDRKRGWKPRNEIRQDLIKQIAWNPADSSFLLLQHTSLLCVEPLTQ